MAISYPHTIDNGAGERITFLRRVPGKLGDRIAVENVVGPGIGPPMHIHHYQDEALTVVQGRMGYQRLGEEPRYGGPGDTAVFAAGEAHKFWNAGDGELRCTGYVEPADNIEFVLGALYDSTKRNGGRPDPFTMYNRYWTKSGNLQKVSNFADDAIDALMQKGREETDPEKRMELYAQAQDLLTEGAPVAFFWNNVNAYMAKPWVKGIQTTPQDAGWVGSYAPESITIDTSMIP